MIWVEIANFESEYEDVVNEANCKACFWNAQIDQTSLVYSYTSKRFHIFCEVEKKTDVRKILFHESARKNVNEKLLPS